MCWYKHDVLCTDLGRVRESGGEVQGRKHSWNNLFITRTIGWFCSVCWASVCVLRGECGDCVFVCMCKFMRRHLCPRGASTNEIHDHIFLCLQSIVSPIDVRQHRLPQGLAICCLWCVYPPFFDGAEKFHGLYKVLTKEVYCEPLEALCPIWYLCRDLQFVLINLLSLCEGVGGERGEEGLNYHWGYF